MPSGRVRRAAPRRRGLRARWPASRCCGCRRRRSAAWCRRAPSSRSRAGLARSGAARGWLAALGACRRRCAIELEQLASSSRSAGFSITLVAPSAQRVTRPVPRRRSRGPGCRGLGIVPQQVEQHEAVDVAASAEIERDRARLHLADHRQRARAGRRDDALRASVVGHVEQDRGEGRGRPRRSARTARPLRSSRSSIERRRRARHAGLAPRRSRAGE